MTFKETMLSSMTSKGMFESQAIKVMENIIENNSIPDMDTRWHEETNGYPEALVHMIWVSVKGIAYDWIEENLPLAWFKPMFQYSDKELSEMIKAKKHNEQIV